MGCVMGHEIVVIVFLWGDWCKPFGADYINNLPLNARRYQQIITLFPGVSNDEGFTLAQYFFGDMGRDIQGGE